MSVFSRGSIPYLINFNSLKTKNNVNIKEHKLGEKQKFVHETMKHINNMHYIISTFQNNQKIILLRSY